jgi:hypothetical protein
MIAGKNQSWARPSGWHFLALVPSYFQKTVIRILRTAAIPAFSPARHFQFYRNEALAGFWSLGADNMTLTTPFSSKHCFN